jgi:hypothetical protein
MSEFSVHLHLTWTAYDLPNNCRTLERKGGIAGQSFASNRRKSNRSKFYDKKTFNGYTRTDSGTMLAYDATLALLQASNLSLKNKYPLSGSDVQQALTELKGVNALQGVTGQIAFGVDGNPVNKAVTIVCNQGGLFKLDMVEGQFLSNGPLLTNYPATSNCA